MDIMVDSEPDSIAAEIKGLTSFQGDDITETAFEIEVSPAFRAMIFPEEALEIKGLTGFRAMIFSGVSVRSFPQFLWKTLHHKIIRIIDHLFQDPGRDTSVCGHRVPMLLIHVISGLYGGILLPPFDGLLRIAFDVKLQCRAIETR
jgi:hypothetical protein